MATLGDLRQAIFPLARVVGPATLADDRAAREVSWVRVLRARVPAFEALETGDLAIIPGPALEVVAPGPAQTEDLAAALGRARIPAALLVDGETGGERLDALGRITSDIGMTVLRLERTDPMALERNVIGFLVNRRAALDRQAGDLERELARLALAGAGLDDLAAAIGSSLGRAVAIESRHGDRLALHVSADQPAQAAALARYLARPASALLRIDIPASADDVTGGGRLALLGDEPSNELERLAAERVASLLALELARVDAVRQAREDIRRSDPLPTDGPPWVVLLAGQAVSDGMDEIESREATRMGVRQLLAPSRVVLRGTVESLELRLVAAAPADDPDGLAVAGQLAAFLGRPVAVSRPFREPVDRAIAEAAARATLEAGGGLDPTPSVLRAAHLPAYRLMGSLHNLPDGLRRSRELLAPILVGRSGRQQERLATLRAVLATATIGGAAAELGVHRNTVAYRIARIEALGGWDLSDPETRFALELAVRLVQDAQARQQESG